MSDIQDERQDAASISDEEFAEATSPSDLKGRINLRIEQALQREIEDIAEDARFPLNSVSEVARFCFIEGIKRLNNWKKRPTLLNIIRAANSMASRDKLQSYAADLIGQMDQRMDWYIARKEYDAAITFVGQVRSLFDDLDDEFWNRYIRTEIDNKLIQWYDIIDAERLKEKE